MPQAFHDEAGDRFLRLTHEGKIMVEETHAPGVRALLVYGADATSTSSRWSTSPTAAWEIQVTSVGPPERSEMSIAIDQGFLRLGERTSHRRYG
jgi:hypothetical protein